MFITGVNNIMSIQGKRFPSAIFAVFVFLGLTSFVHGQDCSCVPDQVIAQIPVVSNLPAIAAQYHLNPVPVSQAGTPPIYLLQITNGQSPVQVAAAMSADARVSFAEINSLLSQVERPGVSWTQ